jgi:hypothetical protein
MLLATHSFPFVSVRRPPACDRLAADSPTLVPGDKVPRFVWRPHSRAVVRIAPDPLLSEVFSAGFNAEKALSSPGCPTGSPTRCILAVGYTTPLIQGRLPARPCKKSTRHVGLKRRVSPLISQTAFEGGGMQVQETRCFTAYFLFFLFVLYDLLAGRLLPYGCRPSRCILQFTGFFPYPGATPGQVPFPCSLQGRFGQSFHLIRCQRPVNPRLTFTVSVAVSSFLPSRLPCPQIKRCPALAVFPNLLHSTRLQVFIQGFSLLWMGCRLAAAFPRSCSLCSHDTTEGNG